MYYRSALVVLVLFLSACRDNSAPQATFEPAPAIPVVKEQPAPVAVAPVEKPEWHFCGEFAVSPADGSESAKAFSTFENPTFLDRTFPKGTVFPVNHMSRGLDHYSVEDIYKGKYYVDLKLRQEDIVDSCLRGAALQMAFVVNKETPTFFGCRFPPGTVFKAKAFFYDSRYGNISITLERPYEDCSEISTEVSVPKGDVTFTYMYFGVPSNEQQVFAAMKAEAVKKEQEAIEEKKKAIADLAQGRCGLGEGAILLDNQVAYWEKNLDKQLDILKKLDQAGACEEGKNLNCSVVTESKGAVFKGQIVESIWGLRVEQLAELFASGVCEINAAKRCHWNRYGVFVDDTQVSVYGKDELKVLLEQFKAGKCS